MKAPSRWGRRLLRSSRLRRLLCWVIHLYIRFVYATNRWTVEGAEVPLRLRMARSVRVSIDGNAHFCRGLLRTRYPESAQDQAPCAHGDTDPAAPARTTSHPLLPLEVNAS